MDTHKKKKRINLQANRLHQKLNLMFSTNKGKDNYEIKIKTCWVEGWRKGKMESSDRDLKKKKKKARIKCPSNVEQDWMKKDHHVDTLWENLVKMRIWEREKTNKQGYLQRTKKKKKKD